MVQHVTYRDAKSSTLLENKLECRIHTCITSSVRKRKDAETRGVVLYRNEFEINENPSRTTRYSCTAAACGYIRFLAGQISMYSFAFKTQRAVENARQNDWSRQTCLPLLALSRYNLHALRVLPRSAGLIALCCAVLAVDGRRRNMLAQGLCAFCCVIRTKAGRCIISVYRTYEADRQIDASKSVYQVFVECKREFPAR